jgi:hypothetical protein
MDRNYIQDHQIVDRYLQDALSEQEKADFEEFFLSDQETLAELELAEKLQQGLRDLDESGDLPPLEKSGRVGRIFASPQYALAATLMLALSIGFSGLQYRQAQRPAVYDNTRIVPVLATRGADAGLPAIVITMGKTTELIVLLIDPGFEVYADYRAIVSREMADQSKIVLELANLQPGYEEMLAVGMPGTLLMPGDYEVSLEARSDGAEFMEINRVAFRVVPGG